VGDDAVSADVRPVALLVVRDALGAALVGALAEGEGYAPAFPREGERGEAAVRRARPAVVVVDAYHPLARRDELFDACAAGGCRVVLFAPGAPWEMLVDDARRRPGAELVTAGDGESLAERLRAVLRRSPA